MSFSFTINKQNNYIFNIQKKKFDLKVSSSTFFVVCIFELVNFSMKKWLFRTPDKWLLILDDEFFFLQRGEKISTYAPKSWSGSEKRNFKVHDPFVLHLKIQAGFRDRSLVNGIDQSKTNSLKPKKVFCCDSFATIVRLWFEEEFRMRLTNAYAKENAKYRQCKTHSKILLLSGMSNTNCSFKINHSIRKIIRNYRHGHSGKHF